MRWIMAQIDHCLATFGELLIVFAELTIFSEPGKGSFDDPSAREDLEALLILRFLADPSVSC
jgi:hypothetical protein